MVCNGSIKINVDVEQSSRDIEGVSLKGEDDYVHNISGDSRDFTRTQTYESGSVNE